MRGGGLLMLGGPDSFAEGKYDRTPIGELLPVYFEPALGAEGAGDAEYRLVLTREGWLQPWVRMRKTEDEEHQRLAAMPPFHTFSRVGTIKPGAVVLAEVVDGSDASPPPWWPSSSARATSARFLIGDLWRWGMRRANSPRATSIARGARRSAGWSATSPTGWRSPCVPRPMRPSPAVEITVARPRRRVPAARQRQGRAQDRPPGGDELALGRRARRPRGRHVRGDYVAKQPGAYRVVATATAPDGSPIGEREAGWAAQPAADEFARLQPDREFLKTIAAQTHGEMVDGESLASFVASLPPRCSDHRTVDVPLVASAPLFSHRHRLPAGRMGLAAHERSGLSCVPMTNSLLGPFALRAALVPPSDKPCVLMVVGAAGAPEYQAQFHAGPTSGKRRPRRRGRIDPRSASPSRPAAPIASACARLWPTSRRPGRQRSGSS